MQLGEQRGRGTEAGASVNHQSGSSAAGQQSKEGAADDDDTLPRAHTFRMAEPNAAEQERLSQSEARRKRAESDVLVPSSVREDEPGGKEGYGHKKKRRKSRRGALKYGVTIPDFWAQFLTGAKAHRAAKRVWPLPRLRRMILDSYIEKVS